MKLTKKEILTEKEILKIVKLARKSDTNFREQCKSDKEFIQVMNFMFSPEFMESDDKGERKLYKNK